MDFIIQKALSGEYELQKICDTLDEAVEKAKNNNSHDSNEIWCQRQIFCIWNDYVSVYTLLKEKRYYDAWCLIEQVLIDNLFLVKNFPDKAVLTEFVTSHLIKLQMLFPYRIFMSTVIRVKKEVCSICGAEISPWSYCQHIPGKLYNGELCMKKVIDFDFLGADIVSDPEHKYAVPFLQDRFGNRIAHYDYSVIETLTKMWQEPFQNWDIEREEIFSPVPSNIKDTDLCPCYASLKNYSDCCKNSPGILSYQFTFKPLA